MNLKQVQSTTLPPSIFNRQPAVRHFTSYVPIGPGTYRIFVKPYSDLQHLMTNINGKG